MFNRKKKLKKKDMHEGEYEVLVFREFETEHILKADAFISAIAGDHTVTGCKTQEDQIIRHVALIKVKNILFGSAYVTLFGDEAEAMKEEAIESGVYSFGDPGKHGRDQRTRVRREPSYYGDTWYYNNTTSSTSTNTMWWTTYVNDTSTWSANV